MEVAIVNDQASFKTFAIGLKEGESERYFDRASQALSLAYQIKGFRPGTAPFEIVSKILPSHLVTKRIAGEVLEGVLPEFLRAQKYPRIGEPLVEFKKLEKAHILFELTVALLPPINLPNWRELFVNHENASVGDEEIRQGLDYIKKSRKAVEADDEFARSLGNFTDLVSLKASIREGILSDKREAKKEEARQELLEKLRKSTTIELAPFLIDREATALAQGEFERAETEGIRKEEYLSRMGKSEEEFRKQAKDIAKTRMENALILNEIAKKEGIRVSDEEVEERVNRVLSRFSSSREAEKHIDPQTLKSRIEQQLLLEKVWTEVLDKQIVTT